MIISPLGRVINLTCNWCYNLSFLAKSRLRYSYLISDTQNTTTPTLPGAEGENSFVFGENLGERVSSTTKSPDTPEDEPKSPKGIADTLSFNSNYSTTC